MIFVDRLIHQKYFVIVYIIAVVQNIVLAKHLKGFVLSYAILGVLAQTLQLQSVIIKKELMLAHKMMKK